MKEYYLDKYRLEFSKNSREYKAFKNIEKGTYEYSDFMDEIIENNLRDCSDSDCFETMDEAYDDSIAIGAYIKNDILFVEYDALYYYNMENDEFDFIANLY